MAEIRLIDSASHARSPADMAGGSGDPALPKRHEAPRSGSRFFFWRLAEFEPGSGVRRMPPIALPALVCRGVIIGQFVPVVVVAVSLVLSGLVFGFGRSSLLDWSGF